MVYLEQSGLTKLNIIINLLSSIMDIKTYIMHDSGNDLCTGSSEAQADVVGEQTSSIPITELHMHVSS